MFDENKNTMPKDETKKTKAPKAKVVVGTTSILMNIPNPLYYKITAKAAKQTMMNKTVTGGAKQTIHEQIIQDLEKQNK